jgi:hypothetical protein
LSGVYNSEIRGEVVSYNKWEDEHAGRALRLLSFTARVRKHSSSRPLNHDLERLGTSDRATLTVKSILRKGSRSCELSCDISPGVALSRPHKRTQTYPLRRQTPNPAIRCRCTGDLGPSQSLHHGAHAIVYYRILQQISKAPRNQRLGGTH